MERLKITLLLLSMSMVFNLFSQQPHFTDYSYKPDKAYFKSYLTVSKEIAISPLRWNSKQWVIAGGVVAGGLILYQFDDEIRQFFQSSNVHSDGADFASKYLIEPWGGLFPAMLVGGFYVYGLSADDLRARQIALGATQAFVMSVITVQVLKHLTHRHRPYQDEPSNPRLWEGPFKGFEYTSFPSGHTIRAFTMASFFSSVYKDKLWVGILSYGIATGVGIQRLYENEHWSSDVFIGAALGIAIGKTVARLMKGDSRMSMGVSETGGISLTYRID